MQIPKKITFMSYVYKVVHESKSTAEDGAFGTLDHMEQEIRLFAHNPPNRMQETLLHEVVHLVCDFIHLELEENDVARLSHGLYHALKENPLFPPTRGNGTTPKSPPQPAPKRTGEA